MADATWTPTLLQEFEKRRGYKLEEHLPELIAYEPKVLSDYRETLGDLLLENFTNQWTAWAHSHGATVRNQGHGSPGNLIDFYAAVDCGYISQNIYLFCSSAKLATVACGAIEREHLEKLIGIKNGKALIAHPVGFPED